jgi:hypothetical protein
LKTIIIYVITYCESVPYSPSCSCGLFDKRSSTLASIRGNSEGDLYIHGWYIEKLGLPPNQKIGGVEDHVHVFSSLSKNIAFSDLTGRLKGSSSKRLNEKGLSDFSWQNGYGAFSVSESNVESVTAYILNQAEHHKKLSYQEEIRKIFKRHRIAFDERYVWD